VHVRRTRAPLSPSRDPARENAHNEGCHRHQCESGCGKSTIATSLAAESATRRIRKLFIDMDPQAQVTQWLAASDGLTAAGTLVAALTGTRTLARSS